MMNNSPQITCIRFDSEGVVASIQCRNCGLTTEHYLTTVCGVTISEYVCSGCHCQNEIWPEDFLEALGRLFPSLNQDEQIRLTEEATRITESWYRVPQMETLLDYKGANLGEGPERELMPIVLQGLFQAREHMIHETKK